MTPSITVEPHSSCKYAVTRDYDIVAVHAINALDPNEPLGGVTMALCSRVMMTSSGAHVWGAPKWIADSHIVAFCQTTEAASKYRTYVREQDREAEGA